jgi:3-hydroxybutyryl-CoA dehydrogenase
MNQRCPRWIKPCRIAKIGIIGAGQMGNGIAHVCALAGFDVVLSDVNEDQLKKSRNNIDKNISRQVNKGFVGEADKQAAMGRITFAPGYDVLRDRDLVIEAATENEEIKRKAIFRDLTPFLKADAMLCLQHLVDLHHPAGRGHRPSRALHGPALHESGAGDEAGGADPRHRHRRPTFSAVRVFAEKLGKQTVSSETSRRSSSTASCFP